MLSAGYDVIGA